MPYAGTACPKCKSSNQFGSLYCSRCATPLTTDLEATLADPEATIAIEAPGVEGGLAASGWTSGSQTTMIQVLPGAIPSGSTLGERYEVLNLLGEGGMGAVYKARDRELDRIVALKVIRPQLAANPDVLARFKQELILARQVTHKNVIRIFDLGMAEGTKFITMEYVEGKDLKTLLQERSKYPPHEAADIILHVCAGLNAAHQENVIHRDLKPHNVMIDSHGRVLVMDFGLALSSEADGGLTRTGGLMGTPDYMSPEQAKGDPVDARSDIFGLGIIFYELLTGKVPFEAESLLKTLLKRTQEKAQPPVELEPDIPPALNDIVMKCLATDPAERYQTAAELLTALEVFKGITPSAGVMAPQLAMTAPSTTWRWISLSLAIVLAVITAFVVVQIRQKPPGKQKSLTLLVADFDNTTGDSIFDGTLESALNIALEGASFVNAYNRVEARRLARTVQPNASRLDDNLARLVAGRESIQVIVGGSLERRGSGYRVSVRAIDAASGKTVASRSDDASSKEGVLARISKLASPIRKALGDVAPDSALATGETFTAASLEAAHSYAEAQELRYGGKPQQAIPLYLKAIEKDPNFATAYAALAVTYSNLGQRQTGQEYFQKAMAHIDRMSERERYRARGGYYLAVRNPYKAIEEFTQLTGKFPADWAAANNLGVAYYQRHDMAKALQQVRRALELYPKSSIARLNVGQFGLYAGEFEVAGRELRKVVAETPSYIKAGRILALSELAQGRNAQAAEAYGRLQGISALGASAATLGLADLALYEGRFSDAVTILEKGVDSDLANKLPSAAAKKFALLAEAELARGRKPQSLAAAQRALASSTETSVVVTAARVYLLAGQEAKTRELAKELGNRLEADPQAYAKLLEGEAQLKRGNVREAITLFEAAQKLADTWLGRVAMGRAYLEAKAYTEADSELDLSQKRRGEATEAFLDEMPTYRYTPAVYYHLGRAREGLKSAGAADAYRTFLTAKEKSQQDALVEDARRRVAAK